MKITQSVLNDAVNENILSAEQAENLYRYLKQAPNTGPSFDFTHVLYYLGGLVAIGAMSVFMNLGWESFGGWGICIIALVYAVAGLFLTHIFQAKGLSIPAGICATFTVALTPLAIYGLQRALGFWPDESTYREYHAYIKWHWLYIELGTLAVGMLVAWYYKYPFLVMPLAATLWYMSMDIASMIAGGRADFELRALVSMYFGLLMMGLAIWVDFRAHRKADYAFWLYLFAVTAFWGGMTSQDSNNELSKFVYFAVNLLMIVIGVVVVRRVFVVFGGIGCALYVGHLSFDVFKDSWLFPISLTVMGFLIIYLGVLWQKQEQKITRKIRQLLPKPLQAFLESKIE